MNIEVREIVKDIIGKPCSRKQVGRMKSLSLGFGEIVPNKSRLKESIDYAEWELGTYYCSWRILKDGRIVCGSQDTADIDDLNVEISKIEVGRFVALRQLTDLDVRAECDNGIAIDFLATISDDDECFHIFCPENRHVEFKVISGWKIGPSDKPW